MGVSNIESEERSSGYSVLNEVGTSEMVDFQDSIRNQKQTWNSQTRDVDQFDQFAPRSGLFERLHRPSQSWAMVRVKISVMLLLLSQI